MSQWCRKGVALGSDPFETFEAKCRIDKRT